MHIVICGEDEVAFRLAEGLMDQHQVGLICPESAAGAASIDWTWRRCTVRFT